MTASEPRFPRLPSLAMAGAVQADGCDKVIFSDVGWTDITATTAATTHDAEGAGL